MRRSASCADAHRNTLRGLRPTRRMRAPSCGAGSALRSRRRGSKIAPTSARSAPTARLPTQSSSPRKRQAIPDPTFRVGLPARHLPGFGSAAQLRERGRQHSASGIRSRPGAGQRGDVETAALCRAARASHPSGRGAHPGAGAARPHAAGADGVARAGGDPARGASALRSRARGRPSARAAHGRDPGAPHAERPAPRRRRQHERRLPGRARPDRRDAGRDLRGDRARRRRPAPSPRPRSRPTHDRDRFPRRADRAPYPPRSRRWIAIGSGVALLLLGWGVYRFASSDATPRPGPIRSRRTWSRSWPDPRSRCASARLRPRSRRRWRCRPSRRAS